MWHPLLSHRGRQQLKLEGDGKRHHRASPPEYTVSACHHPTFLSEERGLMGRKKALCCHTATNKRGKVALLMQKNAEQSEEAGCKEQIW